MTVTDDIPLRQREHVVYRLYGRDGALLYVGMTSRLSARLATHRAEKEWWSLVDPERTIVIRGLSRDDAWRTEARLIADGAPPHNSPNFQTKGMLSDADAARLLEAKAVYEAAVTAQREAVVELLQTLSFRQVSQLTGLSTNTLQRWKREAKL